jgi:hypothetical protein
MLQIFAKDYNMWYFWIGILSASFLVGLVFYTRFEMKTDRYGTRECNLEELMALSFAAVIASIIWPLALPVSISAFIGWKMNTRKQETTK